jgi:hypothetical protein
MIVKCSQLFQLTTATSNPTRPRHRTGGWSEHYYWEGPDLATFRLYFLGGQQGPVEFTGLCALRADLLPLGASIVGQRWQAVNPVGPAQSAGRVFPGTSTLQCDVPQMTLLCSAPAVAARNVRKLKLRGIPDARVIEGEFLGAQEFNAAFNRFIFWLQHFSFRARNLDAAKVTVQTISALGLVQAVEAIPFLVGSQVAIGRTKTTAGKTVNGIFVVESVGPGVGQFTVRNWTAGACTGGYARLHQVTYPKFDHTNISLDRIIVMKIGSPFDKYRGRRSKRK